MLGPQDTREFFLLFFKFNNKTDNSQKLYEKIDG